MRQRDIESMSQLDNMTVTQSSGKALRHMKQWNDETRNHWDNETLTDKEYDNETMKQ